MYMGFEREREREREREEIRGRKLLDEVGAVEWHPRDPVELQV